MKTKFRNLFAVIMVVVLIITTIPAMNAAAVKLKSLDLAFIIDTTGSMSSVIEEVEAPKEPPTNPQPTKRKICLFGGFYAEFHIGETMRTPSTPILRKEVLRVYGYS